MIRAFSIETAIAAQQRHNGDISPRQMEGDPPVHALALLRINNFAADSKSSMTVSLLRGE